MDLIAFAFERIEQMRSDEAKRKQMYHDLQMMIYEDGAEIIPMPVIAASLSRNGRIPVRRVPAARRLPGRMRPASGGARQTGAGAPSVV